MGFCDRDKVGGTADSGRRIEESGWSRLFEESRYLSFSGLRVHFKVIRPDTPVKNRMLMLSSPLINTFHWRKMLPELAELGCLTVPVDLPGFGQSDTGAPQADQLRAELIWGVLDDVDRLLGAPMSMWHLAGHGSACATLLKMAAMYPDSVKSQIHISPTFSIAARPREADADRWFDANILDARRFHRMIERYYGYPMDDYIMDRMRRPLMRPGSRGAFARMFKNAAAPPSQGMGFCPAMAIVGGRDPLIDDARQAQIRRLLSDAETHRIGSAGHFPMETHSRAMRDYLRGWLRYND